MQALTTTRSSERLAMLERHRWLVKSFERYADERVTATQPYLSIQAMEGTVETCLKPLSLADTWTVHVLYNTSMYQVMSGLRGDSMGWPPLTTSNECLGLDSVSTLQYLTIPTSPPLRPSLTSGPCAIVLVPKGWSAGLALVFGEHVLSGIDLIESDELVAFRPW